MTAYLICGALVLIADASVGTLQVLVTEESSGPRAARVAFIMLSVAGLCGIAKALGF
jgi:hypothetical protein